MRRERGFTLIELVVGLVILGVALLAMMSTIPLLVGQGSLHDAGRLAREGRSCAELLIALESAGELDLSASEDDPGQWAGAPYEDALDELCGSGSNLTMDRAGPDNGMYTLTIGTGGGSSSSLVLMLPESS